MRKNSFLNSLAVLLVAALFVSPLTTASVAVAAAAAASVPAAAVASTAIQAPVLKWQHGGCYSSWRQTGWYSSPAVADLNGDGKMEVIGSAYSIFVLDGKTGSLLWKVASGHDRSQPSASDVGRAWAGVVVADVDNDGQPEIVTAHSGGVVSVLDHNGYFKPGWPQNPVSEEFRSLAVADLDGDGKMEIAVGRAKLAAPTLADIDGDGNLDVVLNTADSGLVAYSLPGTVGATILWGTGRGSYQRNGSLPSSLARSGFSIDPPSPTPGSKVTVTIKLTNPGAPLVNVTATDTLPTELSYLGIAQVSCGAFNAVGNTLTWTGAVPMNVPVIVTFQVELSSTLSGRPMISNSLTISYGRGQSLTRQAAVIVNGLNHYLPLAMH